MQKCREGKTHLHEVFSSLRRHIDTRESDLRQELTNVTESAGEFDGVDCVVVIRE